MQIQLFSIPISDNGAAQQELNRFLAAHKILKIEQNFYSTNSGALWCFCVSYIVNATALFSGQNNAKKIDYKELLNDNQFEIFSKLRVIRKELAIQDAVPAYAVFTDAELAELCKLGEITPQTVKNIKGIAEKRMEKYGIALTELYAKS